MVGGIVHSFGRLAIAFLSTFALAAYAPAPHAEHLAAEDAPDRPLFAAAIAHFRNGAVGELRVDPRPLRLGADLEALDPEDLAPADEALTRARAEVLQRLALPSSDVFADQRCQVSAAPAPQGTASEPSLSVSLGNRAPWDACRGRGPFTVLVVSTPSLVEEVNGVATWRIRVARVTSFSYEVRELWLRRAAGMRVA